VSKAFLIFQKFMAPNAYLPISLNPEMIEKVRKIIEIEMSAISEGKDLAQLEARVTPQLFDDILHEIEEKLATDLFQGFFKSKFYAEFKQRGALVEMKVREKSNKVTSEV
jgi:intein-encoded DNA endonuclease-like protein